MSTAPGRAAAAHAALLDPRAYPHPAGRIEHHATHISDVYLAGEFAYKFKKPVDLGFLDFSTLEKRRAACAEELRLNRRLAPEIYLDVVTLCAAGDGMRLRPGGCGPGEAALDYAVRMVRMAQENMLDQMAARGALEPALLIDVARQLARFHDGADHGPEVARFGAPDAVAGPVRQNFEQTERFIGRTLTRERFEAVRDWSERFLGEQAARFEARVRAGRIVDGHGDLHLRNLCLHQGRVVIFDCIEFNPALRAGDALSDAAFLAMDLEACGQGALANLFLNEYLEHSGDYEGLALLDFYTVYHAWVRGKVNSLISETAGEDDARGRAAADARRYFALAEACLAARPPGLLITCGLSGSGKSTLAARAAAALGGFRVRSDAVRKRLAGMEPQMRATSEYGQGIYGRQMSVRTYDRMLEHARAIIAAGRWAVLDATFSRRAHRAPAAQLARELGVPFGVLNCTAPLAELRRRLAARAQQASDISDAGVAVLEAQLPNFEPPEPEEGPVFTWTGNEDPAGWLQGLGAALRSGTDAATIGRIATPPERQN